MHDNPKNARHRSTRFDGSPANDAAGSYRFWLVAALVAFGAAMRLVPHPWNMAPIGAMALFGGAAVPRTRFALAVPLAAMLISDFCLWALRGDTYVVQPFIYAAFLAYLGLGLLLRRRQPLFNGDKRRGLLDAAAVGGSAVVGSISFFVLTNLGVWLTPLFGYPQTWAGLLDCYVQAVPFFYGTLVGDLFYAALLFGTFALCERRWPLFARPVEAAQAASP